MKKGLCSLCQHPVGPGSESLCEACLQMEHQINFLIANHTQAVKKYLGEKFNETADQKVLEHDRRLNPYRPPSGKHTPDRRKKIRRTENKLDGPKRRKSDI